MSVVSWNWVIVGVGVGTFMLRVVPFLLQGKFEPSDKFIRFLVLTSLAIAAGIVSKSIVMWKGEFALADQLIKVVSLMLALGLYARFKSVLLSLFSGVLLGALLNMYFG